MRIGGMGFAQAGGANSSAGEELRARSVRPRRLATTGSSTCHTGDPITAPAALGKGRLEADEPFRCELVPPSSPTPPVTSARRCTQTQTGRFRCKVPSRRHTERTSGPISPALAETGLPAQLAGGGLLGLQVAGPVAERGDGHAPVTTLEFRPCVQESRWRIVGGPARLCSSGSVGHGPEPRSL